MLQKMYLGTNQFNSFLFRSRVRENSKVFSRHHFSQHFQLQVFRRQKEECFFGRRVECPFCSSYRTSGLHERAPVDETVEQPGNKRLLGPLRAMISLKHMQRDWYCKGDWRHNRAWRENMLEVMWENLQSKQAAATVASFPFFFSSPYFLLWNHSRWFNTFCLSSKPAHSW